jgi:hypothetical protein
VRVGATKVGAQCIRATKVWTGEILSICWLPRGRNQSRGAGEHRPTGGLRSVPA